ncbi:MAG TPA: hypothetical protein VLL27_07420 [Solirubrobacterales bacterium]|nr:hypothetical protein [Solirubrobacterales bacterium]
MRGIVLLACLLAFAAAASTATAAVVPVEGSWQAVTSDGLPVYFDVSAGRVVNTRFHFRWGFCGTYGSHDPNANLEIDPNGHWAYEDPRGQTFEATFVAPDRAEGKVISVERMLPGCPRTEATFVATPLPPNPESLAAARAGIEALPYEIRLREPQGVENTLIGKVHGRLGEAFRFFLFVNRGAAARIPGVPGYGFHGRRNRILNPGLMGGQLANTDVMLATVPRRNESKAQEREHYGILIAVEETVCLRQTGKPCPAL